MTVKKGALLVAAAAALASPGALAAPQTTKPTTNTDVHVRITDTHLVLTRHLYARDSGEGHDRHLGFLRGLQVTFIIENLGKKPHAFKLGGLKTKTLMPGERTRLKTHLEYRGRISYRVTLNGSPRQSGYFFVY